MVISIKDLQSHTPQPRSESAPPLKEKVLAEPPMPITKKHVEKSIEEVVTTSSIDDQQVTKRCDTEATNEVEGSLPDVDEMIEMDVFYGPGIPYLFDAGTTEDDGEQANPSQELQGAKAAPTSTTVEAIPVVDASPTSDPAQTFEQFPITSSNHQKEPEALPEATEGLQ